MGADRRPLFVSEEQPGGYHRIVCQVCRKQFQRWHGTSSHGLAHVRRREAECDSDPHAPSTSGHRYRFWRLDRTRETPTGDTK